MTKYTIKQKMSNSGSIYDVAHDQYDRDIKFIKGSKYAVVLCSYYGDAYSTHKSESTAIKKAKQLSKKGYAYEIIDDQGNTYTYHYKDELIEKHTKV